MVTRPRDRILSFAILDGHLVRTVTYPSGKPGYSHRCTLQAYEAVAHAVEETPAQGAGTCLEAIAQGEKLPFTQANVALEFLKERGIVVVRHRHSYPATADAYLDAMIEWHALAEKPAADQT